MFNNLKSSNIQNYRELIMNRKNTLNKERVKLTPARAMLLAVLYDLIHSGEFD